MDFCHEPLYETLCRSEKERGRFHHSSFLAGGATLAAGRLVAENGVLKSISASSGHYRPTDENFGSFLDFLKENGVHLNEVQVRSSTYDSDSYDVGKSVQTENAFGVSRNPWPSQLRSSTDNSDSYNGKSVQTGNEFGVSGTCRRTLSGDLQSPGVQVPKKAILQTKKSVRSYQLGHLLTLKWSLVGSIANSPMELRQQSLKFVNPSPRTSSTPFSLRYLYTLFRA